ncbi:MAG TPA: protein TolQ [Desulfobacteraceae bacterium]|nr:protein TolQ [Desulfobacteraceae bacterium]
MASAFGNEIVQMVMHAGPMVKFVIGVLLVFSIVSWAIIFVKFRLIRRAKYETEIFQEIFFENKGLKGLYTECKDLEFSPIAGLFRAGYSELNRIRRIQDSLISVKDYEGTNGKDFPRSRQTIMDNLRRSLKKATIDQSNRLERALSFLATTGNTAPFIGLFGTVWGIMASFHEIGMKGSANLAVVAPGISEALVATAAGLAAAIPAVVAFNYFTNRVWALKAEMEIFTSDFLSMFERQFFKERIVIKKGQEM